MDRILTIISEYNPLHLGHLYHLQKSISEINPDHKICIMSGNFVQRGEPALVDKWTRTKMALEAGFDMVIELPTIYAISSANNYAEGAIKIVKQISKTGETYLSFGSEIGNIKPLQELVSLIKSNIKEFNSIIKTSILEGHSFPKSQEIAIEKLFGKKYSSLCTPNNILGLEYLRAIEKETIFIKPITIGRNEKYISASEIRELISLGKSYKKHVPVFVYNYLQTKDLVLGLKAFEKEILYKLRTISDEDLAINPELPKNLVTKLKLSASKTNNLDDIFLELKNKSITAARIKRILLYLLLDIKKEDLINSQYVVPYIRVLGIRKESKDLLSKISKNKNVITSVKDFEKTCKDQDLLNMLSLDKRASDIYTLALKSESKAALDYTEKLIVL